MSEVTMKDPIFPFTADGIVRVEWRGECDYGPEDLLARPKRGVSRLSEAMSFPRELLASGPVEQKLVRCRAIEAGLAVRTIERAKEALGVLSEREGWGPGSTCYWRMPHEGP
jgi:hypothetical protein